MKKLLIGMLTLSSLQGFADAPLKEIQCKGKAEAYTLTITIEFAPGSKILTNVSSTKFSVNPNGTARIESEKDGLYLEQVYNSRAAALKFFNSKNVVLKDDEGSVSVLSLKNKTLTVLDSESRIARTLLCK